SLAEELTLLSDLGRLVLEGAAVAGGPFEPELAGAGGGAGGGGGKRAGGGLLGGGPLRGADRPPRLRFPPPARPAAGHRGAAWGARAGRGGTGGAGGVGRRARSPRRAVGAPGRSRRRCRLAPGWRGNSTPGARKRRPVVRWGAAAPPADRAGEGPR